MDTNNSTESEYQSVSQSADSNIPDDSSSDELEWDLLNIDDEEKVLEARAREQKRDHPVEDVIEEVKPPQEPVRKVAKALDRKAKDYAAKLRELPDDKLTPEQLKRREHNRLTRARKKKGKKIKKKNNNNSGNNKRNSKQKGNSRRKGQKQQPQTQNQKSNNDRKPSNPVKRTEELYETEISARMIDEYSFISTDTYWYQDHSFRERLAKTKLIAGVKQPNEDEYGHRLEFYKDAIQPLSWAPTQLVVEKSVGSMLSKHGITRYKLQPGSPVSERPRHYFARCVRWLTAISAMESFGKIPRVVINIGSDRVFSEAYNKYVAQYGKFHLRIINYSVWENSIQTLKMDNYSFNVASASTLSIFLREAYDELIKEYGYAAPPVGYLFQSYGVDPGVIDHLVSTYGMNALYLGQEYIKPIDEGFFVSDYSVVYKSCEGYSYSFGGAIYPNEPGSILQYDRFRQRFDVVRTYDSLYTGVIYFGADPTSVVGYSKIPIAEFKEWQTTNALDSFESSYVDHLLTNYNPTIFGLGIPMFIKRNFRNYILPQETRIFRHLIFTSVEEKAAIRGSAVHYLKDYRDHVRRTITKIFEENSLADIVAQSKSEPYDLKQVVAGNYLYGVFKGLAERVEEETEVRVQNRYMLEIDRDNHRDRQEGHDNPDFTWKFMKTSAKLLAGTGLLFLVTWKFKQIFSRLRPKQMNVFETFGDISGWVKRHWKTILPLVERKNMKAETYVEAFKTIWKDSPFNNKNFKFLWGVLGAPIMEELFCEVFGPFGRFLLMGVEFAIGRSPWTLFGHIWSEYIRQRYSFIHSIFFHSANNCIVLAYSFLTALTKWKLANEYKLCPVHPAWDDLRVAEAMDESRAIYKFGKFYETFSPIDCAMETFDRHSSSLVNKIGSFIQGFSADNKHRDIFLPRYELLRHLTDCLDDKGIYSWEKTELPPITEFPELGTIGKSRSIPRTLQTIRYKEIRNSTKRYWSICGQCCWLYQPAGPEALLFAIEQRLGMILPTDDDQEGHRAIHDNVLKRINGYLDELQESVPIITTKSFSAYLKDSKKKDLYYSILERNDSLKREVPSIIQLKTNETLGFKEKIMTYPTGEVELKRYVKPRVFIAFAPERNLSSIAFVEGYSSQWKKVRTHVFPSCVVVWTCGMNPNELSGLMEKLKGLATIYDRPAFAILGDDVVGVIWDERTQDWSYFESDYRHLDRSQHFGCMRLHQGVMLRFFPQWKDYINFYFRGRSNLKVRWKGERFILPFLIWFYMLCSGEQGTCLFNSITCEFALSTNSWEGSPDTWEENWKIHLQTIGLECSFLRISDSLSDVTFLRGSWFPLRNGEYGWAPRPSQIVAKGTNIGTNPGTLMCTFLGVKATLKNKKQYYITGQHLCAFCLSYMCGRQIPDIPIIKELLSKMREIGLNGMVMFKTNSEQDDRDVVSYLAYLNLWAEEHWQEITQKYYQWIPTEDAFDYDGSMGFILHHYDLDYYDVLEYLSMIDQMQFPWQVIEHPVPKKLVLKDYCTA